MILVLYNTARVTSTEISCNMNDLFVILQCLLFLLQCSKPDSDNNYFTFTPAGNGKQSPEFQHYIRHSQLVTNILNLVDFMNL